jgi:protein-S-isoprenylcysteine O-methyltransferase Ste14
MIFLDLIATVFLFSLFAVSHTILASNKIKRRFSERLGPGIAFYRLFYNFTSLITLALFIFIAPKPDIVVYDLQYPFDIVTFVLQVLSLIGLIWTVGRLDLKEFLGIAQVERYLNGTYKIDDLDERQTLITSGAFKFSRHPVYLFTILYLALRPEMSLFYLEFVICTAVYFYIGSIFEESKLVERFGEEYVSYRKKVPRIFPLRFRKDTHET